MARPNIRVLPPTRDEHRARWEEDYAKACKGQAPNGFDADEYREALAEIGAANGYLKQATETDEMNARIRLQAGRGSQADRDVLAARERVKGTPEA